ncbi:MAG: class I SAM-dependent methyltransferase, partial [Thermoplasmata archaeon]
MRPKWVDQNSAWLKHIPFAFFAVGAIRPQLIVELGVWTGTSFLSFCQAVKELGLRSFVYGVDTFKGDSSMGNYKPTFLSELESYIDSNYLFATLLKMEFDEAISFFNKSTIDILHIDGTHDYESVKHDFETWLPYISNRGIIIMHDTQVEHFG